MSSTDPLADRRVSAEGGATLLAIARESITHGVEHGRALGVDPDEFASELRAELASFVTLRIAGELRGCTGTLEASEPLVVDVARNAHRTAFGDPRFPPVSAEELPRLDFHVSILSPLQPLPADSEESLLEELRPGVDGLVLREVSTSSTFLPAVWKSLPEPRDFLHELEAKAGLPRGHWSRTLRFERYTVQEFAG